MSKRKESSKPEWFLRVRTYPPGTFVTLWLCRRQHGAASALLWGELLPQAVEEIVAALGLPVEQDPSPLTWERAFTPPGCLPLAEQRGLFDLAAPGTQGDGGNEEGGA